MSETPESLSKMLPEDVQKHYKHWEDGIPTLDEAVRQASSSIDSMLRMRASSGIRKISTWCVWNVDGYNDYQSKTRHGELIAELSRVYKERGFTVKRDDRYGELYISH